MKFEFSLYNTDMIQRLKNIYHKLVAIWWANYYGNPSNKLTVIGVTGTDGKTTTTTLIYEMIKACNKKVSMISTVHAEIAGKTYDTGFHVTSPDPRMTQQFLKKSVDANDEYFVLEVTSHAIDQNRIFGIHFDIAVLTNVTHEHLDYHRTIEEYRNTKFNLLLQAKQAVINYDQKGLLSDFLAIKKIKNTRGLKNKTARVLTYGLSKDAAVNPRVYPFTPLLPGDYNKQNILASIAVAQLVKLDMKKVIQAVERFDGVPGRMDVLREKPFRIIVDFAHTPNALQEVLSTVKKSTKNKLIHVFGCAGLRDQSKRPIMGEVAARYADIIILTEEDYRTEKLSDILDQIEVGMKSELKSRKHVTVVRKTKRESAIDYAFTVASPGDTVIITGKGHEQSLCRGTIEYPWNDAAYINNKLRLTKKRN